MKAPKVRVGDAVFDVEVDGGEYVYTGEVIAAGPRQATIAWYKRGSFHHVYTYTRAYLGELFACDAYGFGETETFL